MVNKEPNEFLLILIAGWLFYRHGKLDIQVNLPVTSRIAAAAPFAGLRRFPQGRGFKQWTGDDSKALMKVNSVAIFLVAHTVTDHWQPLGLPSGY
jgi:hypothetical protein